MSEFERQLIDRAELVKIIEKKHAEIERLQAELEHYQNEHADAVNSLAKSAERNRQYVLEIQGLQTERTAIALRVKNLVDAVSWVKLIFTDDTLAQERDPELWLPSVEQALASTDKTADEVIAEWLGEPVAEVTRQNGVIGILLLMLYPKPGSYLYAPKVTK